MKLHGKGLAVIGCIVILGWIAGASDPKEEGKSAEVKEATAAGKHIEAAEGSAEKMVEPKRVELTASDGLMLVGSYYAPVGVGEAPGILMLHQMGGSRQDWGPLPATLAGGGYGVLAMDLRGHGESTKGKEGKTYNYRKFKEEDFQAMVGDAALELKYLVKQPGVKSDDIGIVGASIGANVALAEAAKDPAVRSLVLLSPGLDYHGIKAVPAMEQYKGAAFLVASDGDTYPAESVWKLHEICGGNCDMKTYPGKAHGTKMFSSSEGELGLEMVVWLDGTMKPVE